MPHRADHACAAGHFFGVLRPCRDPHHNKARHIHDPCLHHVSPVHSGKTTTLVAVPEVRLAEFAVERLRCTPRMPKYLDHLRRAIWKGMEHGLFMISKGAAYSLILTLFPAFIVFAWMLAETHTTQTFLEEISIAVGRVLPPGTRQTVLAYFTAHGRPVKEVYSASLG